MSALAAEVEPVPTQPAPQRPRLRIVAAAPATVSTFGFLLILAMLVVLGMGVVMIVTTQVGTQSRDLSTLRKEAERLSYEEAALKTELQRVSSSGSLALRAAELGMVPNPYPAFVDLPTGTVRGEPQPVAGDEAPFLSGRSPQTHAPETPAPSTEPSAESSADSQTRADSQESPAEPPAQAGVDATGDGEG